MRRRHLTLALALSPSFAGAADSTLVRLIEVSRDAVVAVGTYNPIKSPRFSFRGTGFVVDGGVRVVTNAHVLPPAGELAPGDRLAIVVPRKPNAPDLRMATEAAKDSTHDLAVLDIEGAPLPHLTLARPDTARAGTSVALIGFPLGTALGVVPVTHRGIVSAVTAIALPPASSRQLDAKTLTRLRDGAFEILQLDASAYPGNSGSPLFDVDTGHVIGVINMVFVKSTKESALSQPSGITYAIPVRHVTDLLERR